MEYCNQDEKVCKHLNIQKLSNNGQYAGIFHNCKHLKLPYESFEASTVIILGDEDKVKIPVLAECPLNKSIFKNLRAKKVHGMTGNLIRMYEHKFWGDSIGFCSKGSYPLFEISGHMSPKPSVGDKIITKMESGYFKILRIESIRNVDDPPDMFFGTARIIAFPNKEQQLIEYDMLVSFVNKVINDPAMLRKTCF